MQLQKTSLDGTFLGISEMSVLTNQEYLDAGIVASKDGEDCHVILGMNLEDPSEPHEPTLQEFFAFISKGYVINHKFDLS